VILDRLNTDIEYLNKVKKTVEKRNDTISKKQFIKDLFNAGIAYGEEKQKVLKMKEKRPFYLFLEVFISLIEHFIIFRYF
jgi:hypothetical protein